MKFQHPDSNFTATALEYNLVRNKVVLEDNLIGIIDNDVEHEFLDAEPAEITYTRSNQVGGFKGMVYYTNLMLTEKNNKFYRITYTSMDVLGEVGGLIEGVKILIIIILIPFNYNLNRI